MNPASHPSVPMAKHPARVGSSGSRSAPGSLPVEIRRSARRRKTVSARVEDGKIVVLAPADLPAEQERQLVEKLVTRLSRSTTKRHSERDDAWLTRLADSLATQYLDQVTTVRRRPARIRWVSNQRHRWGSCSIATGEVRISDRLLLAPEYVLAAVVMHELAHLSEANHGPRFHALANRYPRWAEAKAWLSGWNAGARTASPTTSDPEPFALDPFDTDSDPLHNDTE